MRKSKGRAKTLSHAESVFFITFFCRKNARMGCKMRFFFYLMVDALYFVMFFV